jgi:lipopolysaccharide transport system ATP-binding protein
MKKHEVTQKLDKIIAFSGIEEFINTPVKRYSSGMYVRLAIFGSGTSRCRYFDFR